jgi:hypothetical protein
MLVSEIAAGNAGTDPQCRRTGRRRARRPIREMILRELSFSGQTMMTVQIAKAINYVPERTQTEEDGQVPCGAGVLRGYTSTTHMMRHQNPSHLA